MDLVTRYLKDVERLKEALLASPVGERVAKIYLFGGVARGAVTEQSDIDVLIVLKNGTDAAEQVADVILALQLEGCGPLEPLTCSVEDLIAPKDYFLYTVTRRGKEIYSMPEEEIRREGARRLRDLAGQYLEAAEDALGRGHLRLALDGAYWGLQRRGAGRERAPALDRGGRASRKPRGPPSALRGTLGEAGAGGEGGWKGAEPSPRVAELGTLPVRGASLR